MKNKTNISKSIAVMVLAMLMLFAFTGSVCVQDKGHFSKVEKSKTSTEQNIQASNGLNAIIPSLEVHFLAIQIDFIASYEAVSLPLLFEIQAAEFINTYFTNVLTHFISPRAP